MIDRRQLVVTMAMAMTGSVLQAKPRAGIDGRNETFPNGTLEVVRAGGLEVAYLESGPSAGRPIVLLHGFPYDVRAFDAVAKRLATRGRRVIVPYLRGFGPTRFVDAATPRVGQQAALGGDLIALLDALHIPRATLAGFDWGARAACVVAALHPERVHGLVTSGGPGYNVQNMTEFLKPRDAAFERAHWFYYYLNSSRGMSAFANDPGTFCCYLWQTFSPTWHFSEAEFDQTTPSFANPDFVAVALHSYRYRIGAVPGDPALDAVERRLAAGPRISAPTIVLQGADEGVDKPEPLASIAPHFVNLHRATALAGVGHNAPQEAAGVFARAVIEIDS